MQLLLSRRSLELALLSFVDTGAIYAAVVYVDQPLMS